MLYNLDFYRNLDKLRIEQMLDIIEEKTNILLLGLPYNGIEKIIKKFYGDAEKAINKNPLLKVIALTIIITAIFLPVSIRQFQKG